MYTEPRYAPFQSTQATAPSSSSYETSDAECRIAAPAESRLLPGFDIGLDLGQDEKLGDVIQRHLRNRSNDSSVYPPSIIAEDRIPALPLQPRDLASPMACRQEAIYLPIFGSADWRTLCPVRHLPSRESSRKDH